MKKKKLVIFTGAGISAESGIKTFRDVKDGLWNNHSIEDVATIAGWQKDRETVLDFYNERRAELSTVEPNEAHKALAKLEDKYDVTVLTQNVDDLHERGGSTKIIHLHGELTKARGCAYEHKSSLLDNVIDIGHNPINIGDKCEVNDSQLRPHIVWFGEMPFGVTEAYGAVYDADIVLIIGTSLQITYTIDMLGNVRHDPDDAESCRVIYIDPTPSHDLDTYGINVEYINKKAVEGVTEVVEELLNN